MKIREFRAKDVEDVLEITLLAFAPTHESFHHILGEDVFRIIYPDWREEYRRYWNSLVQGNDKDEILVAEEAGEIIGFIVYSVSLEKEWGELGLNAVHPEHQRKGVGHTMYEHVLAIMKEKGVKIVEVSTGGDSSHAPARRAYEKCGLIPLPLVRYYKAL